jgi:hypothetical protein
VPILHDHQHNSRTHHRHHHCRTRTQALVQARRTKRGNPGKLARAPRSAPARAPSSEKGVAAGGSVEEAETEEKVEGWGAKVEKEAAEEDSVEEAE